MIGRLTHGLFAFGCGSDPRRRERGLESYAAAHLECAERLSGLISAVGCLGRHGGLSESGALRGDVGVFYPARLPGGAKGSGRKAASSRRNQAQLSLAIRGKREASPDVVGGQIREVDQ
jgi:hypothetical protein